MAVTPTQPQDTPEVRDEAQAGDLSAFTTFMQLERRARQAETPDALRFVIVDETRRLVDYRQAVLLLGDGSSARVAAVSNVIEVDPNAPFIRWVLSLHREADRREGSGKTQPIGPDDMTGAVGSEWHEWSPSHGLWTPLTDSRGRRIGALILFREASWTEAETVLVDRIGECFSHAWRAQTRGGWTGRRAGRFGRAFRVFLLAILVAAAAAMFLPVPQTALAPAEVVARHPIVMAAPIDGVVAEFFVEPNETVSAGTPLFRLEDTELRARRAVAARTLDVAEAELRRSTQQAFGDPESSAQIAVLEARVRVREAELAYAEERLAKVVVQADASGLAVFTDPNDWIGRPVATGERIVLIADPASAELRIDLPVADAIALDQGARVELFLDVEPRQQPWRTPPTRRKRRRRVCWSIAWPPPLRTTHRRPGSDCTALRRSTAGPHLWHCISSAGRSPRRARRLGSEVWPLPEQ